MQLLVGRDVVFSTPEYSGGLLTGSGQVMSQWRADGMKAENKCLLVALRRKNGNGNDVEA